MPRPGVEVIISDAPTPAAAALNTGTAFMMGRTERGPLDRAVKIASLKKYRATFGERTGGSVLYDSVSAFFTEGGGDLYIARVGGAGAVVAQAAFGTGLNAKANSPGVWGNDLTLDAVAPEPEQGTAIYIEVRYKDALVERSPLVTTPDAAAAWAASFSAYVELVRTAGTDLPVAATSVDLTGGVNPGNPVAADFTTAVALFEYGFGPGQVLAPGYVSLDVQKALLAHATETRRCILLDTADTADKPTLKSAVQQLYAIEGVEFSAMFGPWAVYPSEVDPATVTIPYSAVEAGIIARVDRAGNPNAPAAGADGIARMGLDLAQTFSDADREELNEAGVDLAKLVYGEVRTYGYRTAAGPEQTNWLWFGNSRTIMAISYECDAAAETYVLKQIDGRGQIFSRLNKDLSGICAKYYDLGALYGSTPEEAFYVDTGAGINTIETIAAGEIHAEVRVRVSPAAEWVVINIVKVPVERAVAA